MSYALGFLRSVCQMYFVFFALPVPMLRHVLFFRALEIVFRASFFEHLNEKVKQNAPQMEAKSHQK